MQDSRRVQGRARWEPDPRPKPGPPVQIARYHGDVTVSGPGELGGGPVQRRSRGLDERRPQREIFDRVAGEHHLGEHDNRSPRGGRPAGRFDNGCGVAVEIPDGGLDLGESDSKLRHDFSLGGAALPPGNTDGADWPRGQAGRVRTAHA